MLDIRLIRENTAFCKERLATRGADGARQVDDILECDRQRRAAETRLQQLQSERKRMSKDIGQKKARGEDTSQTELQVRGIGDEIARLQEEAGARDEQQRNLLLQVPNLPHSAAPLGNDASANPVVRQWNEPPRLS